MKAKHFSKWILALLFGCAMIFAVTACEPQPTGPRAWIDVPLDGSTVPAGAPVPVVSHVYAQEGIAEVLLSVNGEAYRRSPPAQSDTTLSKVSQDWIPQQAGDYVLQVRAYSKNGQASNPATARVKVLGKTTPTPPNPLVAATPTPTIPPVVIPGRTVSPTMVPLSDLAIVSVEALFVGYKGEIALCKPRVVYRNLGTTPVPNDYIIQLHVNGTPQMTMTRGAGFGVGGTSEAIFDYAFEGAPYIGVNLDSTNAVNESSETNNAFAEIRSCSGTATRVPTSTRTRTPTIVPPASGCSGAPNIASFSASPSTITAGNSTTLSWGAVTNADSVSIEPGIGGVSAPGSRSVSPATTTTYTLTARCGSNTQTRQTTVTVLPAAQIITPTRTRTPTTPPDTQGPPAPTLVSPKGNRSCTTSVTLDWNSVSDQSGIKNYIVKWVRNDGQSGGTVTTSTQHTIQVTCGKAYTWSVQAVDNAGNAGGTASANFAIDVAAPH
ncbi:MAG: hypothetical protein HY868_03065 [Chloroflexi bacterium]|nr:hypothetical protein [Chloroflexota bacterium]